MSTQHLPAQSSPNGGTWVVVWVPLPPSPHIVAQSTAYKLDLASSANNANIQLCNPSRNNAETIQHTCPIDWANKPSLGTSATDYSFLYQSSNASLVAPVPTPTREPTQPTQNRDTTVPSPLGSNMEEAIDRFIESLDSCTAHDVDWNVFSPPGDGLLVPEQISLANHDSLHGASPYTEPYMSATSSPGSSQSSEYTMYPCTEPTCQRSFPSLSIRNKHHRKHSKPFACSVCGKGHSAKRDLHRHLWVKHPEYAERNHVPSQTRKCGFIGCTFEGRQDNLARHIRKLHGV